MSHKNNDTYRIENYLDQLLSHEEQIAFEKELETNSELKSQLETRIKLAKLWNDAKEYEDLKKQISSIIDKPATKKISIYRTKIVAIAAIVFVLIGISIVFIHDNHNIIMHKNSAFVAIDSTNNDSNDSYILKQDSIKNKAGIKYFEDTIIDQLILKFPKNNSEIKFGKTINFSWHSKYLNKATLFIKANDSSDRILYQTDILLSDTAFVLEKQILRRGEYIWFINKEIKYKSFSVK
jgi:hypothetical protein